MCYNICLQNRLQRLFDVAIETHSPIFVNISDTEAVFLVTKNGGATNVVPMNMENLNQIRLEMGISYSDVFDGDFLCVVEGDSEQAAFPRFMKSLGYEPGMKMRFWNLGGYGNIRNVKSLLQYLKPSGREVFLLLDENGEARRHMDELVEEKLVEADRCHVLEKSFEDLFPSDVLIEQSRRLAEEMEVEFELSVDELEEMRKGRNVDKILRKTGGKIGASMATPRKSLQRGCQSIIRRIPFPRMSSKS